MVDFQHTSSISYNPLLRCLQINLRHSKNASTNLSQLILNLSIDVVLIQEPYAVPGPTPILPDIPKDFLIFHDLSKEHAYGAVILVRKSILRDNRVLCLHKGNHAACVEINSHLGIFRFVSLYLRPSLVNFSETASDCFDALATPHSIFGIDANAKNHLWNCSQTNEKGVELERLVLHSKLNVVNVDKQHLDFVPGGTAFVDVTLAGDHVKVRRWLFLPFPSLSDHPFLYFEIEPSSVLPIISHKSSNNPMPKFERIDQQLFLKLLEREINLLPLSLPTLSENSITHRIESLTMSITKCAKQAKTRCLMQSATSKNMPWWSTELCALRTKARRAFKAWSKDKSEANRAAYHLAKSTYQRELRRAKDRTWIGFRTSASNQDTLKALSAYSGKNNTISLPESIVINGNSVSDPTEISEGCMSHFFPAQRPSTLAHFKTETMANSALTSATRSAPPSVSDFEFESAVLSLNPDSSAGHDGLSARLLLHCIPVIKVQLMVILNACVLLCFFPNVWKRAKVSIIGKQNKESYDTLSSYRPISLGSNIAKILEKIILGRLNWHSQGGDWLSDHQHGFRAGRSTETAGHSLVSYIEDGFSKKLFSAAAFLDIKSAFDCAWHPAIIAALSKRSCPIHLLKIVKSFLSDRCAQMAHRGALVEKQLNVGCPQGGVLSPFLWNIMIDDILRIVFPFPARFIAYADDLTVITSHLDPAIAVAHLQKACDAINNWLENVKLSLNASKTVLVIFSRRKIALPQLFLYINGIKIIPSRTVKYLGFLLDAQLKWTDHITQKCVAAKRALFAVYNCLRATWGVDRRRLLFLYESVVEPILLYGSGVWISGLRRKNCIQKLRSFQRSVTLLVTRAFKTAPTLSLLLLSNLRPIDGRVLERAAASLCSHANCYSPASRKFIKKKIPSLVSGRGLEVVTMPHLSSHPPWHINFTKVTLSSDGFVSMLPVHANVMRVYVVILSEGERRSFGFVCCNMDGVVHSGHGQFSYEFSSQRAASYAVNQSLHFARQVASSSSNNIVFEFFVPNHSFVHFMLPNRKLSELEVENFSLIASLQDRSAMFVGLSSSSVGYREAEYLARRTSIPMKPNLLTLEQLKTTIRQQVTSIWAEEWAQSTPSGTKSFFPDVASATNITKLGLKSGIAQLITGHCALNAHQHRFGFRDSPACPCGAPSETVEHFLFACPMFNRERLKNQSIRVTGVWPPTLAAIPENPILWGEMRAFISASKRLANKL